MSKISINQRVIVLYSCLDPIIKTKRIKNIPHITFDLEVDRSTPTQSFNDNNISGARSGKPQTSGVIEDNGIAIRFDKPMRVTPEELLSSLYSEVRSMPSMERSQAATTAASAVLTDKGVTIRGAGDSVVMAIGRNGQVIVLNNPHVAVGQGITNALQPGTKSTGKDSKNFFSWEYLEEYLGPDIKIVTASDGIYGNIEIDPEVTGAKRKFIENIEEQVESLIKNNSIDVNSPDFSKKLLDASTGSKAFSGKPDDVIVLSAKKPAPGNSILLHALDGVGSGGRDSAIVANNAADSTHKYTGGKSERITSQHSSIAGSHDHTAQQKMGEDASHNSQDQPNKINKPSKLKEISSKFKGWLGVAIAPVIGLIAGGMHSKDVMASGGTVKEALEAGAATAADVAADGLPAINIGKSAIEGRGDEAVARFADWLPPVGEASRYLQRLKAYVTGE